MNWIFALDLEIGQIVVDRIVELELALLHLLQQRYSRHRLERGSDQVNSGRNSWSLGPDVGVTVCACPHNAIAVYESNCHRRDRALNHRAAYLLLEPREKGVCRLECRLLASSGDVCVTTKIDALLIGAAMRGGGANTGTNENHA